MKCMKRDICEMVQSLSANGEIWRFSRTPSPSLVLSCHHGRLRISYVQPQGVDNGLIQSGTVSQLTEYKPFFCEGAAN